MKAKGSGWLVLILHMVVLAGFSLTQGCKTAKAGGVTQDQPAVLPAEDLTSGGILPAGGTAPVVSPAVPSVKVYTVQKGDTLSSIASEHGTTWKKLAECNNLSNPNQLKVGQELRISEAGGSVTSGSLSKHVVPVSSRPVAGSIKPGTYVIKKGDLLSTIAKRSGLTVAELKTANGLTSDKISVGKNLTIPKKGAAKAPAAKATAAKAEKPAAVKKAAAVAAAPLPAPAPLADATPAAPASASTDAVSTAAVPAVAVPAAAAPVANAASAPVYEHVLYPGETLDDVARQYGSSQQEIMKLNNITDPASIKPGTKLLVPIPE